MAVLRTMKRYPKPIGPRRIPTKRWKLDQLIEAIRTWIVKYEKDYVSVEAVSPALKAKPGLVSAAIQRLQRAGVLRKHRNSAPWSGDPWIPTMWSVNDRDD